MVPPAAPHHWRSDIIQNFYFYSSFWDRRRCYHCSILLCRWFSAVTTLGSVYFFFCHNLKLFLWLMSSNSYWLHSAVRDVFLPEYWPIFNSKKRKILLKGVNSTSLQYSLASFCVGAKSWGHISFALSRRCLAAVSLGHKHSETGLSFLAFNEAVTTAVPVRWHGNAALSYTSPLLEVCSCRLSRLPDAPLVSLREYAIIHLGDSFCSYFAASQCTY